MAAGAVKAVRGFIGVMRGGSVRYYVPRTARSRFVRARGRILRQAVDEDEKYADAADTIGLKFSWEKADRLLRKAELHTARLEVKKQQAEEPQRPAPPPPPAEPKKGPTIKERLSKAARRKAPTGKK